MKEVIDTYLFEQPYVIVVAAVILEFWLIQLWRSKRAPAWTLAIGLIIAIGALLVSDVVVTEKEQAIDSVREMVKLTEEGDGYAVSRYIAADFDQDGFSAGRLRSLIRKGLTEVSFSSIQIKKLTAERQDGRWKIYLLVLAYPEGRPRWPDRIRSDWEIILRKDEDMFRVIGLTPLTANLQPLGSLRKLPLR
jgi:hypothetical protein